MRVDERWAEDWKNSVRVGIKQQRSRSSRRVIRSNTDTRTNNNKKQLETMKAIEFINEVVCTDGISKHDYYIHNDRAILYIFSGETHTKGLHRRLSEIQEGRHTYSSEVLNMYEWVLE